MAATLHRYVALFREGFSQISSRLVLPERFKGTRIEKAVNYLKLLRDDYSGALKDGWTDAKARPYKAAIYGGVVSAITAAIATNPSMEGFLNQRIEWCNEMALVGKSVRNLTSEDHLKHVNQLLNQSRLELYNLIVCSMLVRERYDKECQLYPTQCTFLQPTYFEILSERIVDIGAFGRWWRIDRMMKDYDLNEEEIQATTLKPLF